DDEGGLVDRREVVDGAGILLGEHAARGMGEALEGAMMAHRFAHLTARRVERVEAARLELAGTVSRALVPGLARGRIAVAGSRIADHERAHEVGMAAGEGKRHVAPEGPTADPGPVRAQAAEQG